MVVDSPNGLFDETLRASALVADFGEDYRWKALDSYEEAVAEGATVISHPGDDETGGSAEPGTDTGPLGFQWDMLQINAFAAHAIQAGSRAVDVGILDSGIEASHVEFDDDGVLGGATNVDCSRGRDFVPTGPSRFRSGRPATTTSSTAPTSPAVSPRR